MSIGEVSRASSATDHRWKDKYGGMSEKEAQRLRDIKKEPRAEKLLADQMLKAKALPLATIGHC